MIEQLFGSKTRVKLLQLFNQNPNRSFYVREITRKIDEQINSVRRELANLLSIGIITSDNTNNRLYYEVNQKYEHYDALSSIFGGKKFKAKKSKGTSEVEPEEASDGEQPSSSDPFVESLTKIGNVRLITYTGQFTRDELTGIDVLIVGDVNVVSLDNLMSQLEDSEKKEIRYSLLTPNEFKYRKEVNDRFISNVFQAKKIVHVDKDSLLS